MLPREYAIRNPLYVLRSLRDKGYVRANTEAAEQYRQLSVLRVGKLDPCGNGWYKFQLTDIDESREALDIAIDLLEMGSAQGIEIDEQAKLALQSDQTYVESIVASSKIRQNGKVEITEEQRADMDDLFLGAI